MNGRVITKRIRNRVLLPILLILLSSPVGAAEAPLWGFTLDGYPVTEARLAGLESDTGVPPQIVVFFLQWPAPGETGPFPGESLEAIWSQGAVPCLTWEPMYYRNGQEIMIPAEEILGGKYDSYLKDFARHARQWERPFLIRFAHEMNLDRYHWGTDRKRYSPESPQLYRKMFRYVVERFRHEGAINVRWVFCPNAESVPHGSYHSTSAWNRPEAYYPGGDIVDILGMDGYNWGKTKTKDKDGWESRWQSFREIFEPLYRNLKRLAPEKPILIFETASVTNGGDRTAWLREALTVVGEWELSGVCWFQADKEADWRLDIRRDAQSVGNVRRATSAAQAWIRRWGK